MQTTVAEIAALVNGTVSGGSPEAPITGARGIRQAVAGDVTFLADSRYLSYLSKTRAEAIFVREEVPECGKLLIRVADPAAAFSLVLQRFKASRRREVRGVHPTALVGADVRLGADVGIGPYVVVEEGCTLKDRVQLHAGAYVGWDCILGEDTVVYPHATIRESVTIGARCVIGSGAVIGGEGFGFVRQGKDIVRIPQTGTVVLGDEVEVGANAAIDRARFGETVIGKGTKIDNLVQIGHNVEMGENCIVCGNAGIAGSAVLGNRVTLAAGSGVTGHVEIGDDVSVAALSGVTKSIPPGRIVSGFPAGEHAREKRILASTRLLPEALVRLRKLEQRIQELESKPNGNAEDGC
ncbi:MAG TPA: UDP-3-O-(3-hydroxymyristoyl)glucosamine N-acyltransferase [Candidatus Hydrogenedentes bacterium]|nr:UDP-3-O-(3-hydroxymyristoyl)glucosamine N-acyltransferase [Candidatus Hydrogenedentota bacterium]